MAEIEAAAPTVGRKKFRKIIRNKLGGYLKGEKIYLADGTYHCPSVKAAKAVVANADVDQRRYISEKHDCDDFAHLLKSAFIEDAYHNGLRGLPYALGIVWGAKPAHAMNLLIANNGSKFSVSIIEPQTGKFYKPSDKKWGGSELGLHFLDSAKINMSLFCADSRLKAHDRPR